MRFAASGLLLAIGVGMSVAAYRWGQPDGPLLYWGILPGAPLVLLAVVALIRRVPLRATMGASIAGFLAVSIPYGLLVYASITYSGGGANIGLGLLLLASPIYVPIAMLIGAIAGLHFMGRVHRPEHESS